MRKRVGIVVAACLYYSGLVALSRWLMQRTKRQLIILNYHRARGGDLRRHLLYLRRHYRVMHLEEALQELYTASDKKTPRKDKRTPLVLTFDDGYHDNYTHLFPLACRLQVPVTLFLIPGYLESGDYFWWGEGRRLVRRAEVEDVTVDGHLYHLKHADERIALARAIDTCLRHASSVAEREKSLTSLRQMLAVPSSVTVDEEGDRPLTWAEVYKMEESGWVSYGAHTMHHPILAYLTTPSEVTTEIETCRTLLEERLEHPIRTFAYPVGRAKHIGEEAVRAVKIAGYEWAVTTHTGVNTSETDPLRLQRVLGDVSRHWLVMAAETSGIWHVFSPLWKAFIGKGESA